MCIRNFGTFLSVPHSSESSICLLFTYSLGQAFPIVCVPSLLRPSIAQQKNGYRNINLFSIAYAFRPRLRSRLTQGGRAFPWKPWSFGGQDSHLPFATHTGILTSKRSSSPHVLPSTPLERSPTNCLRLHSFGNILSPGTFSAQSHSTSELLRTL